MTNHKIYEFHAELEYCKAKESEEYKQFSEWLGVDDFNIYAF